MAQKSKKSAERAKQYIAQFGYEIEDYLTYGEFLDIIVKKTGSSKINFILSKKLKPNFTVNDTITFFDYLPLLCNDPKCESAKGLTPKIFQITPIEIIENLLTFNNVWCPSCIETAMKKREEENKAIALEQAEEIEVNTNLDSSELNVTLEKGRGGRVITRQSQESFIQNTGFGGNIKQETEIVSNEQIGSYEAKQESNTIIDKNTETVVREVSENSLFDKHDISNEALMNQMKEHQNDDDKLLELKQRYMINELNKNSSSKIDSELAAEEDVDILVPTEIPDEIPRVIDPRHVRRRPVKKR